ncbi:MAG TPA: cysteine peptidase family C39 domain-containing protein, partial [Bacilli bacterium]|nr:cysteine peptidase family C39 domain-containing protein [Bacilli bacterium]
MKRKYITKQEDVKDCGAACISSILKYYNGYVPMETIRKDTFTNTEGTTAYHLVIALRKYNFDANGYKIDNILDENIVLPVIAHVVLKNNLTHFVVIYKIDKVKKTVLLMDPAYGYKTLSIEEFNLIWTKVLLVMIPKSKIPKYQKPATIINLFWELLIKEKKLVISIILISFLLMVFSIISSFYIKIILNNLDTNFKSITFLFLSITFLKIVFEFLRINCENKLNKNIDEKMVLPFLKHLFYLPLSYVKTKTTGEIITRVRELNNIKNLFSKIFITFSLDFILASLSMFFIYKLNVKLFLILCFILIIYFILSIIF